MALLRDHAEKLDLTIASNRWQQLAFDECRRTIEDRLAQST
jgi:hypothetical protein